MNSYLITGGAGFIGSNFARYLLSQEPNANIYILDALTYAGNIDTIADIIKKVKFYHGDVTNPEIVNHLASKVDVIIHFAAESHVSRSIYSNRIFFMTDVIGTQTICNSVLNNNNIQKLIHISTSEVFGSAIYETMQEDHPLNPMSPYASAKCGADRLVYSYCKTYDIPAIIVRPFNNYGFFQHLEKVIPRFITNILLNEPLRIHGDGKSSRDYIHVIDNCKAIYEMLKYNEVNVYGSAFNVGTGISTSLNDLVDLICELMEIDFDYPKEYILDRPAQVSRHTADITNTKFYFNWQPEIELREGLKYTIDWYKKNQNWWQSQLHLRSVPIQVKDGKEILH